MTDASGRHQVLRIPDALLEYDAELIYTYNGERFTGVGYEDDPERGLSEISYVNGMQEGPSRDWDLSGSLKGETIYRENARHGHNREFREDGRMSLEEIYEHGVLVRSERFDEDGNLFERLEICPTFVWCCKNAVHDDIRGAREESRRVVTDSGSGSGTWPRRTNTDKR